MSYVLSDKDIFYMKQFCKNIVISLVDLLFAYCSTYLNINSIECLTDSLQPQNSV